MPANERDLEPCSERATRGYPALFCELDPSKRSKPVQLSLLQEARAKLAHPLVQSERPGLPAGAFAFGGVRTPFCGKGLRARRSLVVGQRSGEAECLADARGGLVGLSLRASRDVSAVGCLGLTLSACLCLASHNRGFGGAVARHALAGAARDGHRIPRGTLETGLRSRNRKILQPS